MLIQFTEELSKYASYRPRLCTPGNVRREGDSARHHIQFLGLECKEWIHRSSTRAMCHTMKLIGLQAVFGVHAKSSLVSPSSAASNRFQ